jgi:hypothetical protein
MYEAGPADFRILVLQDFLVLSEQENKLKNIRFLYE